MLTYREKGVREGFYSNVALCWGIDNATSSYINKVIVGRLLIIFTIILSTILALMFWNAIKYNWVAMIYGLPVGLYLPITLTILLFKTFKLK